MINIPNDRKGISVITNFGCARDCWYCIWKLHRMKDIKGPTNWDALTQFLKDKNRDKVSVSGGGDPLFDFRYNAHWWTHFLSITDKLGIKVDVHTRSAYNPPKEFWSRINRCVISSDIAMADADTVRNLSGLVKIRITHTVTGTTEEGDIIRYVSLADKYSAQLTFKELSAYNDNGNFARYKEMHSDRAFFVESGDYNHYYMPDNKVYDTFMISRLK